MSFLFYIKACITEFSLYYAKEINLNINIVDVAVAKEKYIVD